MERLWEVTEDTVSEEQGGFRRANDCVDHIFVIKLMVKEFLRKS